MSFHLYFTLFLCTICIFLSPVLSKTVRGTFTSQSARVDRGHYLSSFCFHGEAVIQYTLNTSTTASTKLYLFLSEDWKDVSEEKDCQTRLEKARTSYDLTSSYGNRTVTDLKNPKIWHILIADEHTCSDHDLAEKGLEELNFINYDIQLLNPDALGNPLEHFSDEETGLLRFYQMMALACIMLGCILYPGLLRFYQMLALAYFVLGCICIPRLVEPLSSGGPMQLVIQLLSVSTGLQAIGAFIMMMHLRKYSHDGIGSPFFEILSEFFDVLSQFAMLYMLLSLSLGWTLGTTYRNTHLKMISKNTSSKIVAVLAILQGSLFLWEQYQDQTHKLYHAHRTYAGFALLILRMLLAGLFGWNLYTTVSMERSIMKRDFYISFTKSCMLWFLSYPVIVVLSQVFAEYLRYKIITMMVVLSQSVAVGMLYKLFLSRSLYWEVSALSSSLPLYSRNSRFDKTMNLKIYS